MMEKDTAREEKAVALILRETDDREKRALLAWLDEIISIRNSGERKRDKMRRIFKSFRHAGNLAPLLRNVKTIMWDERSKPFRLGVGLTAAAAMLMPGQVGLAAAGGAIALPLWMVFGAGYSFALLLSRELRRRLHTDRNGDIIDVEYEVIERNDAR